jgi:hypothetical protein
MISERFPAIVEKPLGEPVILHATCIDGRRQLMGVMVPHTAAKSMLPEAPADPCMPKAEPPSVRELQWESSHGQHENGEAQGQSTQVFLPLNEETEQGER